MPDVDGKAETARRGFHSSTSDRADRRQCLEDAAARLSRLRPDWRDPERFFEVRSELVAELRRIARSGSA